jgi:uncharacterized protein with HEPN domain
MGFVPSSKPSQRYRDILFFIDAIRTDVGTMGYESFISDPKTQRSVIYSLQCISEAAVKLGYHAEEYAPVENWSSIRRFGNVARHDYGDIDLRIIWEIVETGLSSLEDACLRALGQMDDDA